MGPEESPGMGGVGPPLTSLSPTVCLFPEDRISSQPQPVLPIVRIVQSSWKSSQSRGINYPPLNLKQEIMA